MEQPIKNFYHLYYKPRDNYDILQLEL